MIFINLPVADVARSVEFYQAIGATHDTSFCKGPREAIMVWSDTITFMLMEPARFAEFSPKPLADARASAQVLLCLSCDSRADVDAITEAAARAGGRADLNAADDHGFMYGRSFEDPDGHLFGPMWMDVKNAIAATDALAEAA